MSYASPTPPWPPSPPDHPAAAKSRRRWTVGNKIALTGVAVSLATGGVPLAQAVLADKSTDPAACLHGVWRLTAFSGPDYNGKQPNQPSFALLGTQFLTLDPDGTGTLEAERQVTTTYAPGSNWASITDTLTGKAEFHYAVNAQGGSPVLNVTYTQETGTLHESSRSNGATLKDQDITLSLVGRSARCDGSGASKRLTLIGSNGDRSDTYVQATTPPAVNLPVVS